MLGVEHCATSRETSVLLRACALGFAATGVAVALGIALSSPARWVSLSLGFATLVSAIAFGWFAFVRAIDGPRLRALTSERAIELTRSDEVRTIPLARVVTVRVVRELPDGTKAAVRVEDPAGDWSGAVGLELESRDGRRFQMGHPGLVELGPAVMRAVALQAGRPV